MGNFYGTTYNGGNSAINDFIGYGTVFQVTTDGTVTTLVNFNKHQRANPEAGLILGQDGNLYGTTTYGGAAVMEQCSR